MQFLYVYLVNVIKWQSVLQSIDAVLFTCSLNAISPKEPPYFIVCTQSEFGYASSKNFLIPYFYRISISYLLTLNAYLYLCSSFLFKLVSQLPFLRCLTCGLWTKTLTSPEIIT